MVEDGYEFFAKRQLVTVFSAPNYCGEFDNAGAMMSVDETLMCSFQVTHPSIRSTRWNGLAMVLDTEASREDEVKVWNVTRKRREFQRASCLRRFHWHLITTREIGFLKTLPMLNSFNHHPFGISLMQWR